LFCHFTGFGDQCAAVEFDFTAGNVKIVHVFS
jgi:hypothetical protein